MKASINAHASPLIVEKINQQLEKVSKHQAIAVQLHLKENANAHLMTLMMQTTLTLTSANVNDSNFLLSFSRSYSGSEELDSLIPSAFLLREGKL